MATAAFLFLFSVNHAIRIKEKPTTFDFLPIINQWLVLSFDKREKKRHRRSITHNDFTILPII